MAIQDMPQIGTLMSVHEFERIADLPENRDRLLEYHHGKLIEMTSNDISSEIAAIISRLIGNFVYTHKLGRVRGADGGYLVGETRYMPDVSFISKAKLPKPANTGWVPIAPDLAVEVLSPTDNMRDVRLKITNYLNAGTTVWLVDPTDKIIEVYAPNQAPKTYSVSDTLEGGAVLPGFALSVQQIFDELDM
jgi:Uma2 family endonuclease